MKLRLRLGSVTHKIEVTDSSTLQELEEHIAAALTHGVKPVLGLNKTVRARQSTLSPVPVLAGREFSRIYAHLLLRAWTASLAVHCRPHFKHSE